ncbi:hypothetical protein DB346_10515 [Verrucomicrobia bacterium LW23]|nr:hypothetical protein DB346_10515 [Verrucomicrobia bacterium LW23]
MALYRTMVTALFCLVAAHLLPVPVRAAESVRNVRFEGNVQYGVADGQKLLLDIYRPKAKPAPGELRAAVVVVHGGAWQEGNKEEMRDIAIALANRGYVAISISYRLMNEEGTRNTWPAQIDDVQLAVRWLRENAARYAVDPKRISACGGSAGGHLVTLLATCETLHPHGAALTQHSSRVCAAINLAGPTDLTQNFAVGLWRPLGDQLRGRLFAGKPSGPAAREASPLLHIDAATAPVLILHGRDDQIVSVKQSEAFAAAMEKANRSIRLVVIDGEGHGFARPESLRRMMDEMTDFLARHTSGAALP